MTPTEAELLRAAIETARGWQQTVLAVWPRSDDEQVAYEAFETALHALDAYRATPAVEGETVEVRFAVVRSRENGGWDAFVPSRTDAELRFSPNWPCHAFVTARVPANPPSIPTIDGSVT